MVEKRGTELIAIVAIVAIAAVAIVLMFNSGSITGAATKQQDLNIPDEQCYTIASNLDNAASKVAPYYSSGAMENPCTGEVMNYTSYLDPKIGISRRVFENGDAEGHIMVTNFVVCTDGRAEIVSRIGVYWFNRGKGWGIYYLWQKNPHLQYPFQTEKCSTI